MMVKQEPIVIIAEEGESVSMVCEFNHPTIIGLYLKRTLGKPMNVMYVSEHCTNKTENDAYKNRTKCLGLNNKTTITLRQVKKSDSDVYVCEGTLLIKKEPNTMNSSSIILAVKEISQKNSTEHSSSPWMVYALIILSLLMVSILGYLFLSLINIKKYCKRGKEREMSNIVYEDMTYSLRRNTVTKPNLYNE
ncbi:hypothetical protein JD844_011678 [Phrynosoma platyrhinos]|uniref:Ig-like domain-containing protein n=1 Tax=Phrynosoma platyrhinos TaxID=52577 RepID=A0ABQ7TJ86_PHRPL|nr:hypothetical protein JD844_011678 [Phrynosoma platyrhinos]